jgi:hypothetical protein
MKYDESSPARTGMKGSPLKVFDGGRHKSAKHFMQENGSLDTNTWTENILITFIDKMK